MKSNSSPASSGFLGLDDQECEYETSKYVVVPVGYEQSTTFGQGTAFGPQAIIRASHEVELYDHELDFEPYRAGIHLLPNLEPIEVDPETMIRNVASIVRDTTDDNKFIITLGGEHTISLGPVKALARRHPDLSILQFDAHADLRNEYQNNRFSHACVMRRIREIVETTVGVGIRSL